MVYTFIVAHLQTKRNKLQCKLIINGNIVYAVIEHNHNNKIPEFVVQRSSDPSVL